MVSSDQTNEGAASILRAVGSLLVALSGGQAAQIEGTLGALQAGSGPTPAQAPLPSSPPRSTLRPRAGEAAAPVSTPGYPQPQGRSTAQAAAARTDLIEDVELVLADARERAQGIIDESTERARELIRQEQTRSGTAPVIDPRALDDLRSGLRNLVTEVRDIQQRLARIEQLIREQNERAAHQVTTSPTAEPQYAEPQYAEADQPEADQPEETAYVPAPAPPRSSFSVVPPQRREWGGDAHETEIHSPSPEVEPVTTPAYEPAYEPPPSPPRTAGAAAAQLAPDAGAWDDDAAYDEAAAAGEAGSPLVTFLPSDGAITLRVAPVAGFQGLMRVQEALTRIPAVRTAAVDTYSQGEARLHIELADTSDSDAIAEGLARALGGIARVQDASEVHRELFITLR